MSSHAAVRSEKHNWVTVDVGVSAAQSQHAVPMDTLIRTVWAITSHIYTGDETIEMLEYTRTPEQKSLSRASMTYQVERAMSAQQIAASELKLVDSDLRTQGTDDGISAISPLLLVKKTALLFTHIDDVRSILDSNVNVRDQNINLLCATVEGDQCRVLLRFPSGEAWEEAGDYLVDTLKQAWPMIFQQWQSAIGSLQLLGPQNQIRILQSTGISAMTADATLGDIITQQAIAKHDQPAIDAWDGRFTYNELYDTALHLAKILQRNGIGIEERVPLCMKKSKWAVAAMFGTFLAGGTCVPLDINSPPKRLIALTERLKARLVVTDQTMSSAFKDTALEVITFSDTLTDVSETGPPMPKVSPSAAAFIYFTSGSTGTPKGVVLEHGSLYAAIREVAKGYGLNDRARVFQYAAYVFDVSMGDIFGALMSGSCLCIPSEENRMDDPAASMNAFGVTHACFTTTVLRYIQPSEVPSLQRLFVGGELLEKTQVFRWSPSVDFNVVYGTTESLIWDSLAVHTDVLKDHKNLGRPVGPCLWVMDVHAPDQLCPVGAIGEILIEGPLLARGYMDDIAATSAKFIPAPSWMRLWRQNSQLRCYRTGDLGCRNADGTVSFVGRADTQVKIRGQRVEIGEIEHSITKIDPTLKHVIVDVTKRSGQNRSTILAAFVYRSIHGKDTKADILAMNEHHRRDLRRLKTTLADWLPPHMVPAVWFPIARVPRAATGKLDRITLKRWSSEMSAVQVRPYYLEDGSSSRPPKTAEEKIVQQAWVRTMNVAPASVSAESDFFQSGGDSIKAMELVGIIRDLGRSLSVATVFQNPRLSAMAAVLGVEPSTMTELTYSPFDQISRRVDVDWCVQEAARACNIDKDLIEDIYGTTPTQEALLAASARRTDTYYCQLVFEIPESLDVARFKSAWESLTATQPIFRSRVCILPELGSLQVVTRSKITWDTNTSLQSLLEHTWASPMTYGTDLSRYAIVRDGVARQQYFIWRGHHAIYDGWSQPLMFREICRFYRDGTIAPQVPYWRFISYLDSLDAEKDAEFWRAQFSDLAENFPRLPRAGYAPKPDRTMSLDLKLTSEANSEITTSTLIQAAWAVVVARHLGSDHAVFGLTLSGRDAPVAGVTSMLGPTITTVPLRINLDNTMAVKQYLHAVQAHVAHIRSHQYTGLQNIRRLGPEASSAVDFQTLLVVHPSDFNRDRTLSELGLELVEVQETDTLEMALTIQCIVDANKVGVRAQFDEMVIDAQQLESLLYRLEHVLFQLTTGSLNTTIHGLDMMSPYDLDRLAKWNFVLPPTVYACIHTLVEEQGLTTPHAPAISGFDHNYTYSELDIVATRLASHLSHLGVRQESRVVLCFSKSSMPIIAMLAVLKSGGACVSVNPDHPLPRLLEICSDVTAEVLLCDESAIDKFKSHVPHVVAVNINLLEQLETEPDYHPISIEPSNASFVVYTSGSTGKPKGSVLEHQALCTSLQGIANKSDMTSTTRTLQFSAYTFDAHILEIFGTLLAGGCVSVISDVQRMNRLAESIRERQVNWALLTPTVARLLTPKEVPTIKTLVLSGEPLAREDVQQWADQVRLLNGLGPSECSILACLTDTLSTKSAPANIGHALGCHLWITDRHRPDRLMPLGATGELIIKGPILGREYVNRPKATAAAFITNPTWSRGTTEHPRRFYRTGDLAKFNMDGSVTFVGRADHQVKIRGQRVELGEIEHNLKVHGQYAKGAAVEVVTIASRADTQHLVAFVVWDGESQPQGDGGPFMMMSSDLRSHFSKLQKTLTAKLPRYMVPSLYFPVRDLPVSTSGKLERKTLRAWASSLSTDDLAEYYLIHNTGPSRPTTEKEEQMLRLWSQILKLPENTIGIGENFFQLGGDSVTAMQLIAAARAVDLSLTVTDVFQFPQLFDMSRHLRDSTVEDDCSISSRPFDLIRNRAGSLDAYVQEMAQECRVESQLIEDIYPCTPVQEALMAVSAHRPRAYTHQSVFQLPPTLDLVRFRSAWEAVVSRHVVYRTRIVVQKDLGAVQVILSHNIIWRTAPSLQEYLEKDQQQSMEYGGELTRFALVPQGDGTAFIWTAHHSTYDGWSLARAFEEVCSHFQGDAMKPVVPYKNFIRYLASLESDQSNGFWRDQFPDLLESFPRLPSSHYTSIPRQRKTAVVQLDHQGELRSTSWPHNTTMATITLAAWALVTAPYTDGRQANFGLALSGRDAAVPGITEMMGPTIATLPMRISLDPIETVSGLLQRIQRQVTQIRRHQYTSLQRIRHLSPEARAATKFQCLVVVQTVGDADIKAPFNALGIEAVAQPEDDFFDLALTVECIIRPKAVRVNIQYDKHVINDIQVELLLKRMEHVLLILLASEMRADALVQDISPVSQSDLHLIDTWHGPMPPSVEATVHGLFEKQVHTRPEAPAISGFDGEYTYAQIDLLATHLAAHLTKLGLTVETRVVLCFAKSTWSIVAMLAVLKAGGVCVSINPEHTRHRLLEIFEGTGAEIVLCDPNHAAFFTDLATCIVAVDHDSLRQIESYHGWHQPDVRPQNAAFVIYASGITGKSTGSVLEHRSLCTTLTATAEQTGMNEHTRALQFSSFTFGAHIFEIFATWIVGGCVCIVLESERSGVLTDVIRTRKVNWSVMTPTSARIISPDQVPSLKTMVLVGEPPSQHDVWKWAGRVRLFNGIGPLECSILASLAELTMESEPSNIGFSIGCQLWITDHASPDRLVPIGCVGEILIEGPIVGRGSLDQSEVTTTAFVTDLAWSRSWPANEPRLPRHFYRTGDLGRFNADGSITLMGQRDTQVTIHGQRIELGDIEYQIKAAQTRLHQAAVEFGTVSCQGGRQTLTAFIEYNEKEQWPSAPKNDVHTLPVKTEIRLELAHLRQTLSRLVPSYMVPTLFVPICRMPRLATGKLDRQALRQLLAGLTVDQFNPYALNDAIQTLLPTTAAEQLLQKFWAKVLDVPVANVSVEDHFFQLGGDSALAMHLIANLRELRYTLSMVQIFRTPRLRDMALAIKERCPTAIDPTLKPFALMPKRVNVYDCISDVAEICQVDVSAIEDIYPATPMQEALVAVSAHRTGAYHLQMLFKLPETLDLIRLKEAWQSVATAQAILRTRIVVLPGFGTVQAVLRPSLTWRSGSSLQQRCQDDRQVLAVSGAELVRFAVVNENDDLTFIWTIHHALYDAWSLSRIFDQVQLVYRNQAPSPVVPYRHFIHYLTTVDVDASVQFWREQFSETMEKYPLLPSANCTPIPCQSRSTVVEIKSRAATKATVTTATLLQAAYALVVSQCANTEDALFGLTLSGRDVPVPGIADIMGPTLATVPIQMRIDRNLSIADFLQSVQTQVTGAQQHQHIGLHRIRGLGRNARAAADVVNLLTIQNTNNDDMTSSLQNLGLEAVSSEEKSFLDLALAVECVMRQDVIEIVAQYDSSLVPDEQVESLLRLFTHAITVLKHQPEQMLVKDLDLIPENDVRQQNLWNHAMPETVAATVHELVERRAILEPDATALSGFDGDWTYGELNCIATKLAIHLTDALGCRPEARVVLCFTKSVWPIVAMLAVLKSGGVCVSVNPDHPHRRLLEICDDTDTGIVLCDTALVGAFSDHIAHVMTIDGISLDGLPDSDAGTWVQPVVRPNHASFVVYTSGSTGKPKGSVLEHQALCTSLTAIGIRSGLNRHSRILQFSAYTFDAHILEIFGALIHGGCVCVISDEDRLNNLSGIIRQRQVNWSLLTPTVSRLLKPESIPDLRTLIIAGEPATQQDLVQWAGHLQLFNGSGPSECSILSSLTGPLCPKDSPSNIGFPMGCLLWIVDRRNPEKLAPTGCIGEMVIEGPIIGREYLNRPQATATSFVRDLEWSRNAASGRSRRFYRTGDLAKFNPDGSVTHIGRADLQVKIRGQRVELGEIESQIRQRLPPGSEALVEYLPATEHLPEPTLVAFLRVSQAEQISQPQDPTETILMKGLNARLEPVDGGNDQVLQGSITHATIVKLQQSLSESLPKFMIPAGYVPISFIPSTPSGKADRIRIRSYGQSLTRDDMHMRDLQLQKAEPSTDMEIDLCSIWSRILNRRGDDVGIDDTFTSLGGDSINAMQVVAECRKRGIKITVSTILGKRTVRKIAPCCSKKSSVNQAPTRAASDLTGTAFGLSPVQRLYLSKESPGWTQFNQSFLLRLRQQVSMAELRRALDVIVERHGMLRARFARDENSGIWQQRIAPVGSTCYRLESHQIKDLAHEVEPYIQQSGASLDIVRGPVFSVDLFDVEAGDNMLFMVAHHLVIDLVSWRVVWRELEEVLRGATLSSMRSLSFGRWCELLEIHSQSQATRLDEILPWPVPPSDYGFWHVGETHNMLGQAVEESFSLDANSSGLILGRSNDALRTNPLDILLGVLVLSFRRVFTEREAPAVFVEQHGREVWDTEEDIDISETVGWFTAMYPLHVPLESSTAAIEAISMVKDLRYTLPGKGRPYFACRHLLPQGTHRFKQHDPAEIIFNYAGSFQQLESHDSVFERESRLKLRHAESAPNNHRWAMIDVGVAVTHGLMNFSFSLNREMAHLGRVRQWIRQYKCLLAETAAILADHPPMFTPTDFPLLKTSYAELGDIIANLGHPPDKIRDIFPLSCFQTMLVRANLETPPRHWDYVCVELPPTVELERVQQACRNLINQFDSLRTVFIQSGEELLQVVLSTIKPQIDVGNYDGEADAVVARVCRDDLLHSGPGTRSLGRSFVRFMIVRTRQEVRLILRLSHAQYDAMSLGSIATAFASLYEGKPVSKSAGFVEYIRHCRQPKPHGYDYWRSLLKGSELTTVPQIRRRQGQEEFGTTRMNRTVPPFKPSPGVTPASIFSAACAILLASMNGSSDVIFGRLVSGRAGLDSAIQDVVGPCANIVPMRVQVKRDTDKLLSSIQNQLVDSIAYETMGWTEITQTCTDWSADPAAVVGSPVPALPVLVQFRNFNVNLEAGVAGSSMHLTWWDQTLVHPFPRSLCLGAYPEKNGVRVSVSAGSAFCTPADIEYITTELCNILERLQ